MRARTKSRGLILGAAGALVAGLALAGPTAAAAENGSQSDPGSSSGSGLKHEAPNYNGGKKLPTQEPAPRRGFAPQVAPGVAEVGDAKLWPALNDAEGRIYFKNYTLRGIGDNIQIWVADDRAFPGDDCRNALGLTEITDAQMTSFIDEFDNKIYPIESEAFSVAPDRNGASSVAAQLGLPADYWKVDQNRSDDIAVLVDNVRDANYFDPSTPSGQTYIAGFFYSVFNSYTDRNVMTIDAYDWIHRTGANPPDDSDDPQYQACEAASGEPRPRLYEGVFAHEYQHLLEFYEDPDEVTWVNEGLSDYAQSLVGYVDTSIPVTDPGADSHLACFAGFLADEGYGGPENSLTAWSDQGGPEILCDYGATYSFMQYLYGHYGRDFLSRLHTTDANGLTGLADVLGGDVESAMDLVHTWAATMALDNVIDGGASLLGGDEDAYSEDSLGFQINWRAIYSDINHDGNFGDTGNEAFSSPGAPPNGADYVRLGKYLPQGKYKDKVKYFDADKLKSVRFTGSGTLAPTPVQWTVDAQPPAGVTGDTTCGNTDAAGTVSDPALYSGCGPGFDRTIARQVSVPAADPTLTFETLSDIESTWDYGFVQVSTDDGQTWTSLANEKTSTETASGAIPAVKNNVPGFTGSSDGWVTTSFDLSAYAGQQILLGFRYVTDPAANEAGFYVDDVVVGGQAISDGSSLASWQTYTQINPDDVHGWTVQLVAYTEGGSTAWVGEIPLTQGPDGLFQGGLSRDNLEDVIGESAETVAAIVMQDDPSETVDQYAAYRLVANNRTQPGGGGRDLPLPE